MTDNADNISSFQEFASGDTSEWHETLFRQEVWPPVMRLAVVGDSLGLPRMALHSDCPVVRFEQAYPERLRRHLLAAGAPDVMLVDLCRHAQTSMHLLRGLATEVFLAEPHALVLQLGMVDLWPAKGRCVPPPFPDLEGRDPWVDAAAYRHNLDAMLRFCSHVFPSPPVVVLVNIWPASEEQYAKYPAARERTLQYNEILDSLARENGASLVDAHSLARKLGPETLGEDGIHWTPGALDRLALSLRMALLAALAPSGHRVSPTYPGIP